MPDTNFVNVMLISGNINYFNRIIKKYDTLDEYQALGSYYITTLNFDPGNNLTTTLIIGSTSVNALTFDCNYLLIYNSDNEILQRWWVMDQKRTRAGQYTLSLKRDVIADFYDIVTEAPCFIEKATIRDFNDPLIFNKEDMQFNQIKKSETFIKDQSKMAWIVGYIDRTYAGDTWDSTYDVIQDYSTSTLPVINSQALSQQTYRTGKNIRLNLYWRHYTSVGYGNKSNISKSYIQFENDSFSNVFGSLKPFVKSTNPLEKNVYEGNDESLIGTNWDNSYIKLVADQINTDKASVRAGFYLLDTTYGNNYCSIENYQTILNANGKIYLDSDTNKYYKIIVTETTPIRKSQSISSTSNFGYAIAAAIQKPVDAQRCSLTTAYSSASGYTELSWDECSVNVQFQEFKPETTKIKISASRNHLNDAPYDMFAIPYTTEYDGGIITEDNFIPYVMEQYVNVSTWQGWVINKETAAHVAQSIIAHLGGGGGSSYIYDVQILPYCPIKSATKVVEIYDSGTEYQNYQPVVYLPNLTEDIDYNIITNSSGNKHYGVILWATQSSFTFNKQFNITPTNPKIDFETKMYRLVSPNYSGMFEFSPAMNGGVSSFNVDATYKPYQPYIHINPDFNFMYGKDFNDNRGLICGGDFSLSMVDDKWANFEINNKNYQLIFDREVQNMEFNRKQARVGEAFDLVTGTAAGAAQGAMVGGAVGAVVGGVASAAGGAIDIGMSEARYKESLSLKKDLFGYNLGNIRALPASLTKATSLNENFKFWPFLEEYECSDIEKEALELKLKYDGMTVMKIGKMSDYIAESEKTFIKGQIIRLENLPEASDVAYEIYNEIKKGVYI